MPQFNTLNLGAVDRAAQSTSINAMNMQKAAREFGEQDRVANTKWLLSVAQNGMNMLEQNPEQVRSYMQAMDKDGQRRGVWKKLGIDYANMSDEELMQAAGEGFNNMGQSAQIGLAGMKKPERYEDVMQDDVLVGQRNAETNQYTDLRRGGTGGNARLEYFNELSDAALEVGSDGKPTRRAMQAQTQLGTRARMGSSSTERIAENPELTDRVAESGATIAGAKTFAERTGANRAKTIDTAFQSIETLDKNVRNIDKAIAAIADGAATGPIVSRLFPSIREASVKLDQIRNELGLDVVGGVTFGALSKGELDLALNVALPDNLPPDELSQWLQDKKVAQQKLRDYLVAQIDFLDQGGTPAQFLRQQQRGGEQPTPTGKTATNPQTGQTMQEMSDGTWQ